MPLAFGAILGGTCTLIGTSTNLAVSGAMPRYGLQPFSMFELTRVGVPIVAIGMLYMLVVGLRLLATARSGEFTDRAISCAAVHVRGVSPGGFAADR